MTKGKKIKSSWTNYFNFSARERRGALFLSAILMIQIFVLCYINQRKPTITEADTRAFSTIASAIKPDVEKNFVENIPISRTSFFSFNPNEIDDASWKKLGLSEKQIKVINRYKEKGGKFRTKKDFKKMFCIPEYQYSQLHSFIQLPDSNVEMKKDIKMENKKEFYKQIKIDIGSADSTAFLSLRGIGPVFASRIVRYREKLGGFYSAEQLKEVWGVTDSLYQVLFPFLILKDSTPFRFIHLNTDSFKVIASHPYLKGKLAGMICNYRKQHKQFSSLEELKALPLITEENFRKLAPYLRPD